MSEPTAPVLAGGGNGRTGKPVAELTDEELHQKMAEVAGQTSGVVLEPFFEIDPKPLCWLWPSVFPMGKLSLIAGDPGLGKSLLTVDMASRVSTGRSWPDGEANEKGGVIILSAEDDPEDTIRPRLDAAGADVHGVYYLRAVAVENGGGKERRRQLSLQADIPRLDAAIGAARYIRLLVIDPVSAYLGDADSHINAQVRALLAPLAELAARRRIAVVAVTHLNKSGGPAMYRTMGSLAFTAASRAVWAVGREKQGEEAGEGLLFLPVKNNLAPNEGGFRYRIETTAEGIPVVRWDRDRVAGDLDVLLAPHQSPDDADGRRDAEAWLEDLLSGGPVATREIQERLREDRPGFSWMTVRRAKQTLGVETSKDGFQGRWTWHLPAQRCSKVLKEYKDVHPQRVSTFGKSEHLWRVELDEPELQAALRERGYVEAAVPNLDGDTVVVALNEDSVPPELAARCPICTLEEFREMNR